VEAAVGYVLRLAFSLFIVLVDRVILVSVCLAGRIAMETDRVMDVKPTQLPMLITVDFVKVHVRVTTSRKSAQLELVPDLVCLAGETAIRTKEWMDVK
jgi:hypothetical protein